MRGKPLAVQSVFGESCPACGAHGARWVRLSSF